MTGYGPKGVWPRARLLFTKLTKSVGGVANDVFPVYQCTGAPTNGTSGTLAGIAEKGALMVRVDSPAIYQNTGTLSNPTWTILSTTSGTGDFAGTVEATTLSASSTVSGAGFDAYLAAGGKPAVLTTLETTGLVKGSVANGVSTSATKTRTGATQLTKQFNRITTIATTGDAVTLPALAAGQYCDVFNDHASKNAIVFANGASDAIDGGTPDTGYATVSTLKRARFVCFATNVISSFGGGVAA